MYFLSYDRSWGLLGRFIACLIILALCCGVASANKALRVVFLSPGDINSGFWGKSVRFAQAVAEDLDIDLQVVISPTNSRETRKDGLKIINSDNPPEYLITSYWFPATQDFIPESRKRNINLFIIVNRLPDYDRARYGAPREIYKNWIGHTYVDDFEETQRLSDALTSEALRMGLVKNNAEKVNICGLVAGNEEVELRNDSEHVRALRLYAEARNNVDLNGVYYAYWHRGIARAAIPEIIRRHGALNVLWAQNHRMALGAIEGLEKEGRRPGRDIVVGSFNWATESLKAIESGKQYVSLGGHFTSAGIALIMIYDYHNGKDFVEDTGASFRLPLGVITRSNVKQYLKALDSNRWSKLDFRKFSKVYNPDLKKYNFSPDILFNVHAK